jgi:hypothetical protein
MALRRRQLPVHLTDGETICPRKTVAVPAIVSVSTCKQMHDNNALACEAHECQAHLRAKDELQFLRKHADAAELMFHGAGSEEGKSDGEDTSADAV